MKWCKIGLALFSFITLFAITKYTYSEGENRTKAFSLTDTAVLNIKLSMEKGEVEKRLGKPIKTEKYYEDAFGTDVMTSYYKFGTVRFEPGEEETYIVSTITINKPNFVGPRGIRINDKINEVIKKFPNNQDEWFDTEGNKILYKDGNSRGYITYGKNRKVISITYQFDEYTLWIKVQNNVIRSITLNIMTV